MIRRVQFLAVAAAVLAAACDSSEPPLGPDAGADLSRAAQVQDGSGAVYLSSNASAGNAILIFDRAPDGTLLEAGAVPTGGLGTGAGLGNQLAMVLTPDQRFLYVVNAGSDDISAFRLTADGIEPVGAPVPSGGDLPVSLTVHDGLLYALNAGVDTNITGFRVATDGSLSPLPGSTRPLSGANTGPAQIEFAPNGRVLVVTEKNTNTITTYVLDAAGLPGAPQPQPSVGNTPFGFSFDARGDLVVSEAGGTGAGTATASAYRIDASGRLTVVTGGLATTQVAACWIAIGQSGRNAYTTNTGSGTVSRLGIGAGGALDLIDAVAGDTGAGSRPQDADFTPGGRFLYVRNAAGSVSAFRVAGDGELVNIGEFGPIPPSASGIVAR